MKKITQILIILLLFGCNNQKSELSYTKHSDLNNLFEVEIPAGWDIEKSRTEHSSTIFFSDTTKLINDVVVYDLVWDSLTIYLNDHFRNSLDSISLSFNQKPSNQKFDTYKDFKTYEFDVDGFDTLNQILFTTSHSYLKNSISNGHLRFSVRRHKSNLSRDDSLAIQRIWRTIKLK